MKKILVLMIVFITSLSAELINKYPTAEFLNSNVPIVDIRTKSEWIETGVLKDAITITFFDENGRFNLNYFLKELSKRVDTTKEFALICRTGSRTSVVSDYLANQLHYKVVNLQGGMVYVKSKHLPIVKYKVK